MRSRVKGGMASGVGALAIGSVVAKMLGALYRIPLTNILGAEGMGIYQLVFPVYALFMVLATAGIPTAMSRMIAEKRAVGESGGECFRVGMLLLALLGVLFGVLLLAVAKPLARWQGNTDTYWGFVTIAPAIPLVCIISGFRGYFQGQLYMLPTALSNVVEQVVKLAAGIALSVVLARRGVVFAVCGALVGVVLSELVAMVYMLVTHLVRRRGAEHIACKITRGEVGGIIRVAIPIALVGVLMPLSSFFDSVIAVNMLKLYGLDEASATAQYGLASGPVNSLINMPVVAIMSLAVAIVPSVSASRAARDIDGVMLKSRLCVRVAYVLGIFCSFYFMVFAKRIIAIIYPSLSQYSMTICSSVLRITAANVTLLAVMQIYVSLLQALDRTKYAVLSLVCAISVKIVLALVLTKRMGIYGYAIACVSLPLVAFFGVNISYIKICGMYLAKNIGANLLLGVIMALCGIGVLALVKNTLLSFCIGTLVCLAVYVWLVLLLGIITREDLQHLPLKRLLYALHRIIRFWEYSNEAGRNS